MSAVDIVQRQLEAYNARDLKRFVATYVRRPDSERLVLLSRLGKRGRDGDHACFGGFNA